MSQIINAANISLSQQNTSVPDVSGALQNYFQQMVFTPVSKAVEGFQVVETPTPINFWGSIAPFTPRALMMKPEGQRKWSWYSVFCEPGILLKPDDVILYQGVQYRIMSKMRFSLYGYEELHMIEDYEGAGP